MDRRVVLVADPASLLFDNALGFELRPPGETCTPYFENSASKSRTRQHRAQPGHIVASSRGGSSSSSVAACNGKDSRHLEGILDHLSRFCKIQPSLVEHADSPGFQDAIRAARPVERSRHGHDLLFEDEDTRVKLAAVFPCPPLPQRETSPFNESDTLKSIGSGTTSSPTMSPGASPTQRRQQQQELQQQDLSLAFADVLDACGSWLSPAEFEARVLGPTRSLLRQRSHSIASSLCSDSAANTAAVRQESTSPSSTSRPRNRRKRPRPGSPAPVSPPGPEHRSGVAVSNIQGTCALLPPHGMMTSEDAVELARDTAEELALLLREAGAPIQDNKDEPQAGAVMAPLGDARGRMRNERRLVDVFWVVASPSSRVGGIEDLAHAPPPSRGNDDARSPTAEECTVSGDSKKSTSREAAVPTCPTQGPPPPPVSNADRVAPIRDALRSVCRIFPDTRVTVWPRAAFVADDGAADRDGSLSPQSTRASGDRPDEASPPPRPAGQAFGLRRQWASWCQLPRCRIELRDAFSTAEEGASDPFHNGLVWRGPLVIPSSTLAPTPLERSSSASATERPAPAECILDGFDLRVLAKQPPDRRGMDSCALARSAATFFARASGLRFARKLSAEMAAQSCHLLIGGASAPAIELYVRDRERFPGSAKFLEELELTRGGGILLVAEAAPGQAGGAARGTAGSDLFDGDASLMWQGLALACFPKRQRCGRSHWSVRLFRRPWEFSQGIVRALVGGQSSLKLAGEVSQQEVSGRDRKSSDRGGRADKVVTRTASDAAGFVGGVLSTPVFTAASLASEACRVLEEAGAAAADNVPAGDRNGNGALDEPRARPARGGGSSGRRKRKPKGAKTGKSQGGQVAGSDPEGVVGAVVDAWARRLGDRSLEWSRGDDVGGRSLVASAPAIAETTASSLAYAIYGTFGTWRGPGTRPIWAEELLLPGPTTAAAGKAAAHLSGGSVDHRFAADSVQAASTSDGTGMSAGRSAPYSGGDSGQDALSNRPRSSAEQALDKAGQQQRARAKERRMVAREQRERMERMERHRSRIRARSPADASGTHDGAGGSNGVVVAPRLRARSAAGGTSGTGPGTYRRGASRLAAAAGSVTGRSLAGSKLSRGNLILGRSVSMTGGTAGDGSVDVRPGALADSADGEGASIGPGSDVGTECSQSLLGAGGGHVAKVNAAPGRAYASAASAASVAAPSAGPPQDGPESSRQGNADALPLSSTARMTVARRGHDRSRRAISQDLVAATGPLPSPAARSAPAAAPVALDDGAVTSSKVNDVASQGTSGKSSACEDARHDNRRRRLQESDTLGGGRGEGSSSRERQACDGPAGAGPAKEAQGDDAGAANPCGIRRAMEQAMLAAIASQTGLSIEHPRVREVFERETRRMAGRVKGDDR